MTQRDEMGIEHIIEAMRNRTTDDSHIDALNELLTLWKARIGEKDLTLMRCREFLMGMWPTGTASPNAAKQLAIECGEAVATTAIKSYKEKS